MNIVEVVVGNVNMWIIKLNKGSTVYPHVDRLCISTLLLPTLSIEFTYMKLLVS